MKSTFRLFAFVLCGLVVLLGVSNAQDDLAAKLSQMGFDAAKGYTGPILSGWAADINSGFYYSADLHDVLGFDVGVKLSLSRPSTEDKTFTIDMPGTITYAGQTLTRTTHYPASVTANSSVGDKAVTEVRTTAAAGGGLIPAGTLIMTLPGGFDLPAIPLPMPQVNVGLPLGLEVMARFVPTISAGDAGKFSLTGFGVRYSIDQWIPLFPIDIAAHFFTQKMSFKDKNDKDIFTGSGTAYGVEVSKKLFILTVYGGFQLEKGKMELGSFTGKDPSTGFPVTIPGFTVDGKNTSRITLGARILLLLINAHVEYSIAKNPVITAGVGISIR
jgi:hypothetical protein